jgi:hypothetical protein
MNKDTKKNQMGLLKEYFLNNLPNDDDVIEKMHYLCLEEQEYYEQSERHIQEGTTTQR